MLGHRLLILKEKLQKTKRPQRKTTVVDDRKHTFITAGHIKNTLQVILGHVCESQQ